MLALSMELVSRQRKIVELQTDLINAKLTISELKGEEPIGDPRL